MLVVDPVIFLRIITGASLPPSRRSRFPASPFTLLPTFLSLTSFRQSASDCRSLFLLSPCTHASPINAGIHRAACCRGEGRPA